MTQLIRIFSTILPLLLLLVLSDYETVSQLVETSCCGAKLADGDNRAILDRSYQLLASQIQYMTIKAVKIQLCASYPVYVQLWRKDSATNSPVYILDWQKKFFSNHSSGYSEVHNLEANERFNLTSKHILGLYAPGLNKIPVRYIFKDDGSPLAVITKSEAPSSGGRDSGAYEKNVPYIFNGLEFPRTFREAISFCADDNSCPKLQSDDPPSVNVIQGPPGPPGPPGPSGNGPIGGPASDICVNGVECKLSTDLKSEFDRLNAKVNQLLQIVNDISQRLVQVANQESSLGTCPPNFFPGTTSIPFCFMIVELPRSFAEAILHCSVNGARLVSLETANKDSYVINKLRALNPSSRQSFWTSGMYNIVGNRWVWLDEKKVSPNEFTYTNWGPGEPPSSSQNTEIYFTRSCVKVTTAAGGGGFWETSDCSLKNFFVCQVSKSCS